MSKSVRENIVENPELPAEKEFKIHAYVGLLNLQISLKWLGPLLAK